MTDADDAPEVGSLGEEAARLLGALSGWARDNLGEGLPGAHGSEVLGGLGNLGGLDGVAARAAAAAQDLEQHLAGDRDGRDGEDEPGGWREHLATGSPECTVCPVCRTVHAVRQVSPEVREHLGAALGSLARAAAALLDTSPPDPAREQPAPAAPPEEQGPGRVQDVAVGDDWPDDALDQRPAGPSAGA